MTTLLHLLRLCLLSLAVLLQALPLHAAETVTYLHPDTHGSPVVATDAAGNVVWRESFMPYGDRRLKQSASAPNGLWYTGKVADDESGLIYLGARWYDPSIGRFLAVDPVGFTESSIQSFNRYAYGNNNPYKFVDPKGHFPIIVPIIWAIGAGLTIHELASTPVPNPVYPDAISGTFLPGEGLLGGAAAGIRLGSSAARSAEKLSIEATSVAKGTTVLGKFPDYIKLADDLGAKRFNIPTSVWNRMSAAEQWAANQKFLDRAIARGDNILLSNTVRNINDVTGTFRRELDYLIGNGFQLSADGTRLIR